MKIWPRCVIALLLALPALRVMAIEKPPDEVVAALARGVNLPIWFTYRGQEGVDPARWHPDEKDWQLMHAMGLRHVRIPFDPRYFQSGAKSPRLHAAHMQELKQALEQISAAGLLAVLAAQPSDEQKARYLKSDRALAELTGFWQQFATALKSHSPQGLLFEALNEPTDKDAARSQAVMHKLVEAIRAVAPEHTVVVEGAGYSGVDELLALKPLSQPNLVYSFHFYEPANFTHQGAFWSWPMFAKLQGLPYPSSPVLVESAMAAADEEAMPHVRFYGQQNWNKASLTPRFDAVRDWARQHDVVLWCSEFGVSRLGSPDDSRRRWLRDVRTALEARGIGWSMFDYVGNFALVNGNAGARQVDARDMQALGLQMPGAGQAR